MILVRISAAQLQVRARVCSYFVLLFVPYMRRFRLGVLKSLKILAVFPTRQQLAAFKQ